MTTYNVATESAEKLAVRINSKGGASAMEGEYGVLYLKAPLSVSVDVTAATGGHVATSTTYFYYVTRVVNGVESFGVSGSFTTGATSGGTYKPVFTVTDIASNVISTSAATSYNLYAGITSLANAVLQSNATVSGTTITWASTIQTGTTNYTASPAMVSYPQSSGAGAYNAPTWVDDALAHNPNATTGFSGTSFTGAENQVRQIRTSVVESQIYSRTDTATVTSGSGTVSDTSITWADFGKPVTGTGIPTNAYVGTVTPGTSFVLSSVQGQNVPCWPGTTNAFQATANGTSITVSGSNVGPLPVQVGQYRTTRWQG